MKRGLFPATAKLCRRFKLTPRAPCWEGRFMVHLLVAAALAAGSPAGPAAADQPAIFKVQDADTTIFLFGTFHALDSDPAWLDTEVRSAFDSSDELVLETLLPEPGTSRPPGPQVRMPSAVPSGSFLASTRMAINAGRAQGMQVATGADMVLRQLADSVGKPVEGLETFDLQLRMFDKLRIAAPVRPAGGPSATPAAPMDALSQTMSVMQSAWKRGDQSVFTRMLDQLRRGSPDTYRTMFIERNERWADWVAARMRQPGTVFIAVGAGHLAGRDSLLVRLAEHGIESQRVG
jgi:uncharacterized protein YbaP (TraB family)